jgi:ABC-2 type transport system ATP-binding protein
MEAMLGVARDVSVAPVGARPLLSLGAVSKSWGPRTVLDNVSLALAPGTITWLSGANGVGKTTLVRIAAGLLGPDRGTVAVDGLHPLQDRREYQARLGFLGAGDRGIYARLYVYDHLKLCARLALMRAADIEPAVQQIVTQVGLAEFMSQRADRVSMGQRQRLRIAMTFLHAPRVVLLDEPLTSLDADGTSILRSCIADVLGRSGTVLWCSPGTDGDQIGYDRRLALEQGKLLEAA